MLKLDSHFISDKLILLLLKESGKFRAYSNMDMKLKLAGAVLMDLFDGEFKEDDTEFFLKNEYQT